MKKILVAVDFSAATDDVVEQGITVARAFGSSLDILHVRELLPYVGLPIALVPDQQLALAAWIDKSLVEQAQKAITAGISCVTNSLEGIPYVEIVAHAKRTDADLIVVGTHGRRGLSHVVMGSVAERVVQKAACPVLVVPQRRTES